MRRQNQHKPPWVAEKLLNWITDPVNRFSLLGDLAEEHSSIIRSRGHFAAYLWYWGHLALSLPKFILNRLLWSMIMINNYLKMTFRSFRNSKVHTTINIFGLALGLSCAILIYFFVNNELTYDQFHEKSDRLFAITTYFYDDDGGDEMKFSGACTPMRDSLIDFFPEIVDASRIRAVQTAVKIGETISKENITCVDTGFFSMFSYPLLKGNAESVLKSMQAIVLTKSYAKKYFGDEDPVGKSLLVTFGAISQEMTITGIVEDSPLNSTFQFNMLMNFEAVRNFGRSDMLDNKRSFGIPLIVELKEGHLPETIDERFDSYVSQHFTEAIARREARGGWDGKSNPLGFSLQNLAERHLDSDVDGSADFSKIFILSAIGISILFIACINFMNITVGKSSLRSLEIGVRKVLGAEKRQLRMQFFSESICITAIATVIGFIGAILFLPTLNEFTGLKLSIATFVSSFHLFNIVILIVFVGISAGLYPAVIMSSFRPIEILRGKLKLKASDLFSRSLIVLQFSLSALLIIGSVILGRQINFMTNSDPGYDKDGVVVVEIQAAKVENSNKIIDFINNYLKDHPGVENITAASLSLGQDVSIEQFKENSRAFSMEVDYNYFETLKIDILEGRVFQKSFSTDTAYVVVNQEMIRELEFESPIGKTIEGFSETARIIGVVEDANNMSLKHKIYPAIYELKSKDPLYYIYLRIDKSDISGTLDDIRAAWTEIQPDKPFLYSFLDDNLKMQYEEEIILEGIVNFSTTLAVLIACMGIFGLTSLTISRRIKEIGIRKVLGAKVLQIVKLIVREIVLVVCIANVIAAPIAWYLLEMVLQDYYYRIEIVPMHFVLTLALSLGVALFTVMFIALKAAFANPVDSLRYE